MTTRLLNLIPQARVDAFNLKPKASRLSSIALVTLRLSATAFPFRGPYNPARLAPLSCTQLRPRNPTTSELYTGYHPLVDFLSALQCVGSNETKKLPIALIYATYSNIAVYYPKQPRPGLVTPIFLYPRIFKPLLAPQSGALRISAYRDFQSNPIHL